ncbi:hypothetical protein [Kutzneria sp. NPDC051319]|uniref:hypothetical protein n=1 Tax=Kutzneria sp. NPDC051319 TaxID=3155047 RepID=UPI00343DF29F
MAKIVNGGVKIIYNGTVHIYRHQWRYAGQMTVLVVAVPGGDGRGELAGGRDGAGPAAGRRAAGGPVCLCRKAEAAVAKFGLTELDEHYGNFDRCDLVVHRADRKREIDVEFQFQKTATLKDTAPKQQFGSVLMENDELDEDGCDRVLMLAGGTPWTSRRSRTRAASCCAPSRARPREPRWRRTRTAPWSRGGTFPSWSLANRNACTGLDSPTLTRLGLPLTSETPKFGGWACEWGTRRPLGQGLVRPGPAAQRRSGRRPGAVRRP